MTDANRLHQRDNRIRAKLGWGRMSWIPPRLPDPKTFVERVIRKRFRKELKQAYLVHIYNVVDMLEQAYRLGWEQGVDSLAKKFHKKTRRLA